jgi:hypothetical protein
MDVYVAGLLLSESPLLRGVCCVVGARTEEETNLLTASWLLCDTSWSDKVKRTLIFSWNMSVLFTLSLWLLCDTSWSDKVKSTLILSWKCGPFRTYARALPRGMRKGLAFGAVGTECRPVQSEKGTCTSTEILEPCATDSEVLIFPPGNNSMC